MLFSAWIPKMTPCQEGFDRIGGKWCVKLVMQMLSWTDARDHCESLGGALITFDSECKQTYLLPYIGDYSKYSRCSDRPCENMTGN